MVSMLILQGPYLPSAVTESPAGQMFKPSVTFPYLSGHRIIITAHLESSCVSIHASNPLALLCMWSEHQKRRPASSCARRSVVVVQARHLMRCSAESIKRAVASRPCSEQAQFTIAFFRLAHAPTITDNGRHLFAPILAL